MLENATQLEGADPTGMEPEPRRRPRAIADAEFDMTPMIDCTFLLLLFFMLTTTYELQKTVDTPPPPGQNAAIKTRDAFKQDTIFAKITKNDLLYIDEKFVDWKEAREHLSRKRLAEGKPNLIIETEDEGKWGSSVRLQDEATLAGFQLIRFGEGVQAATP